MPPISNWKIAALAAAMMCLASPGQAQIAAGSSAALSSDEPIEIESDELEVRENDGIAIFTGNVVLVQGKTLLKTAKMTVHYAQGEESGGVTTTTSSQIERLEAEGKVYVKTGNQVATGDKGTFNMKQNVIELTGQEVVLTEGENVVVGCKLTVEMGTGRSQIVGCGRVKMLLQPGSQKTN